MVGITCLWRLLQHHDLKFFLGYISCNFFFFKCPFYRDVRLLILEYSRWSMIDKYRALMDGLSLESLLNFVKDFKSQLFVEGLVQGNVTSTVSGCSYGRRGGIKLFLPKCCGGLVSQILAGVPGPVLNAFLPLRKTVIE